MTSLPETLAFIRQHAPNFQPQVGLVLGSGLGALAEQLVSPITIPYQAIPGLNASNVTGHASLLVMGYLNDVPVACLKGRLHRYEGASWESIQTMVRMIKGLGARTLIVTGAAGSLNAETGPGDMLMVNDHINLHPGNPLVGPNDESIGPRFVSLENAYDRDLRELFQSVAKRLDYRLPEGVYISLLGPSFETPAEIRAWRLLGADAVGMSVVPEVIIARHCGLKVAAITAITNLAVGMSPEKVTHEVTLQNAAVASHKLVRLITGVIQDMGRLTF